MLVHRRLTHCLSSAALAALAAGAMMTLPASANAADSFNPGLTRTHAYYDCTIKVGVVRDTATPWAAIGGTQVNCPNRHGYISASVSLKFNGAVVNGSTVSTNFVNAYGFGDRILKTPRFCGAGYWQVIATITTPEHGSKFVTNGSPDDVRTACR